MTDHHNVGSIHNLTYEKGPGQYELYNLADDPGEWQNLADRYPDRVQAMLEQLESIKAAGRSR